MEPTSRARALRTRLTALGSSARYGRLRARIPRYAFLGFVVVMCLAGIRSVISPTREIVGPPNPGSTVDYAEQSFALTFARAYLTYDAADPEAREAALASFVSVGLEGDSGFSPPGTGSQSVRWAEVAQVQRPLAGGVIISVAAQLSTRPRPVYLSVPVDRNRGGAIRLAGYPSFVGPPLSATSSTSGLEGERVEDSEVSSLVQRALGNYLAGDAENLSADLADAATVTLPTNPLRMVAVDQIFWVSGAGGGAVLATVSATDSRGGAYTLRYEVGIGEVGAADPRLGPGWRVTYVQTISQRS